MGSFAVPSNMTSIFEWFYSVVLAQINSVPCKNLWVVFFSNIPWITAQSEILNYENGTAPEWFTSVGGAISYATSVQGMLFAQAVTIPGEDLDTDKMGGEGTGLLPGNIMMNRRKQANLSVTFLDTNFSFADLIIRPWLIMVGYQGLKGKNAFNYKTSLNIMQFAKNGTTMPFFTTPRAHWIFHGVVPVTVDAQSYDYNASQAGMRQINFVYDYYTVNSLVPVVPEQLGISLIGGKSYKQVNINQDDYVNGIVQMGNDVMVGSGDYIKTNVGALSNNITKVLQTRAGEILNSIKTQKANQDTVQKVNSINKKIESNDTPKSPKIGQGIYQEKVVGQNDIVEATSDTLQSNLRSQNVKIDKMDIPINIQIEKVTVPIKDTANLSLNTPKADNLHNQNTNKVPGNKFSNVNGAAILDTVSFNSIPKNTKTINSSDVINSLTLDNQQVDIKEDTLKSLNIKTQNVVISDADTANQTIPVKIVNVAKNDIRK